MPEFESLGLKAGTWSGLLRRAAPPGRIDLIHMGETVAEARISPAGEGVWRIEAALPPDRLSEGVQSFMLVAGAAGEGDEGGERIAGLSIVAGQPLESDLRAEIELIRAELDLLKREFRRLAAG